MINFSIIIPHKDIPTLLQRCLDSIPQREDLEVIIVDDNSSPDIVDFTNFSGHDRKDVKAIFTKEGKGAGYARNVGLKHAQGKWVLFADADDFFTYGIRDILDSCVDSDADVVYFDSCSLDSTSYTNVSRYAYTHEVIKKYFQNQEEGEFLLRFLLGVPWAKMIRRSLIEEYNIRFDTTPINNDTTFSYLVGYYAKTISVCNVAGYCVTTRQGSISTELTDEKHLTAVDVFSRKYKFLKEHNIEVLEEFIPGKMNYFKRTGRMDLFARGLDIIEQNGLDKEIVNKRPTHDITFFYEDIERYNSFLISDFGQEMYKSFCGSKKKCNMLEKTAKFIDTLRNLKYKLLK